MSAQEYEHLLREAITNQSKVVAPEFADDVRICASWAAEAIGTVTKGAAALDLIPLLRPFGFPPALQLLLRRVGRDEPASDLGVYNLARGGYPIQHWQSRASWEAEETEDLFVNRNSLEDHFRWLVSNRSSRLVVLVAFIVQQGSLDLGK